ncbi:MAG: hypothetical protein FH749_10660 [Firmicutes bacterium]|nr:hypothetical protein [Bacillota bacterium]
MAKVRVHAGDFLKGSGEFGFGAFALRTAQHRFFGERIPASSIEELEVVTERDVKKLSGTLGWGAIGGIAFGPVGLLGGLLIGGRRTQVTFVARFKDGRKLLASTDSKTYSKIRAACF